MNCNSKQFTKKVKTDEIIFCLFDVMMEIELKWKFRYILIKEKILIEEPQNLIEGSIGISYYTSNSVYSVKKGW